MLSEKEDKNSKQIQRVKFVISEAVSIKEYDFSVLKIIN
jgi:hypothetical protein